MTERLQVVAVLWLQALKSLFCACCNFEVMSDPNEAADHQKTSQPNLSSHKTLSKPRFRCKQLSRPQAIPPTAQTNQDLSRIQLLSAMNRSSVALEIIKQRPRLITDIGNLCENESKSFCKLFSASLMQSTRSSWMKYIIGFCRSRSPRFAI